MIDFHNKPKKEKKEKNRFLFKLNNLNYFTNKLTIPPISIKSIANHIKYHVNTGNSRKRINKINAKPTMDPPAACCVSTIISPPFSFLIFNKNHNINFFKGFLQILLLVTSTYQATYGSTYTHKYHVQNE